MEPKMKMTIFWFVVISRKITLFLIKIKSWLQRLIIERVFIQVTNQQKIMYFNTIYVKYLQNFHNKIESDMFVKVLKNTWLIQTKLMFHLHTKWTIFWIYFLNRYKFLNIFSIYSFQIYVQTQILTWKLEIERVLKAWNRYGTWDSLEKKGKRQF